ncbi:MAG TPA: urease accessory protein UreD [Roseiarcus sp.]|nr:urease accessory protein UreD [Roseiarcus sp.]
MDAIERAPLTTGAAGGDALPGPEFAPFQDEPPQMPSGAVGKRGFLRLGFEQRGGRTVLADLESRAPYLAQRALHCDSGMPDLAWLFVITTSGCVLQGDRLALDVTLAPGACAHVTTQSATKVHAMDANYAVATQSILIDDGAYLEFLPDPLLLHRRARFASETRITVAPTATLLYSEIVQPGRKHHHPDESLGVTLLSLRVSAARPDGRLLMSERLVIEPESAPMRQTGIMDSFDVFGNVILLTPKESADRISERVTAEVDFERGTACGACRLPNEAGLIYKALGRESAQVKAQVRAFWEIVRGEVAGASVPPSFLWR